MTPNYQNTQCVCAGDVIWKKVREKGLLRIAILEEVLHFYSPCRAFRYEVKAYQRSGIDSNLQHDRH